MCGSNLAGKLIWSKPLTGSENPKIPPSGSSVYSSDNPLPSWWWSLTFRKATSYRRHEKSSSAAMTAQSSTLSLAGATLRKRGLQIDASPPLLKRLSSFRSHCHPHTHTQTHSHTYPSISSPPPCGTANHQLFTVKFHLLNIDRRVWRLVRVGGFGSMRPSCCLSGSLAAIETKIDEN